MKLKHYIYILLVFVVITTSGFAVFVIQNKPEKKREEPIKPQTQIIETKKEVIEKSPIKEQAQLNVPYTVQAPLVNWNIHEESCEEAALLMVHYYLLGNQTDVIEPSTANQELINMVTWEKNNYGQEKDLNMYEVGKLATDYYEYRYKVSEDVTVDDIKQAVSDGNPVLVPVITHALGNPYYGPSPSYHILVIKGYNQGGIISNDAGVKEGKDYYYTWDVLWRAIDAQSTQMNQGRDMLVVTK